MVLSAVVSGFPPVRLAFAWAQADAISVILGQVNFFLEFDVCFFRSRGLLRSGRSHDANEARLSAIDGDILATGHIGDSGVGGPHGSLEDSLVVQRGMRCPA